MGTEGLSLQFVPSAGEPPVFSAGAIYGFRFSVQRGVQLERMLSDRNPVG